MNGYWGLPDRLRRGTCRKLAGSFAAAHPHSTGPLIALGKAGIPDDMLDTRLTPLTIALFLLLGCI